MIWTIPDSAAQCASEAFMSKEQDPWPQPRYMMRGSPLVGGGKARLMSAKKVTPKPAKPREVSEREEHGYTELPHLALDPLAESLDEDDWDRHIGREVDQRAKARELERERSARLLSQEERIVKAQQEAQVKRRDVSRELWVLRQMQARGRPVQVIEKRVQGLERVVYLGRRAA